MVHGEEVLIRDLGSTNGTIVDGERLMGDLVLTEGDLFQVGPLVFQIVIRPAKTPSPQPTAGPGSQSGTAQAPSIQGDEIVQWLVSDSKNEVPATGSGVYSGKTVFVADDQNKQPETGSEPKDPVRDSATDAAKGDSGGAHPPTKGHATPHTVVEYGAAAHAAEDMLRHFLHRRPHR
jgi:predicted component of type VI protein secretion system